MSSRPTKTRLAIAAIAATALLAGCGDDGDSTDATATGETQPLASFIAEADRICTETTAQAEEEIQEAVAAAQGGDPDAITEAVVEVTIPTLREQFERIGELPPPEGNEAEVEEILTKADDALAQAEENPDLIIVEEGRETPFDEVSRLERELGLKVCGAAD